MIEDIIFYIFLGTAFWCNFIPIYIPPLFDAERIHDMIRQLFWMPGLLIWAYSALVIRVCFPYTNPTTILIVGLLLTLTWIRIQSQFIVIIELFELYDIMRARGWDILFKIMILELVEQKIMLF